MYLAFLREFAHPEYTQLTSFQIEDMLMSIFQDEIDNSKIALETAWNCTRRYGKSRNLTIIAVFFCLLNKEVIWRTPYSTQLKQAGKWFSWNPFVEEVAINTKNTVFVYGSTSIDIGVLSVGRAASQECDILIYDEGGWVEIDKVLYEIYKASRPMIANSNFKVIIHASTPARYTAFDEAWQDIKVKEDETKLRLTSEHPYQDCYWVSDEFVEDERRKNADTPWFVEQNYECKWVVYGGAVFNNIYEVHTSMGMEYAQKLAGSAITHIGVDFNAGDNMKPHYLLTMGFDAEFVYIKDEYTFTNLQFLFDRRWSRLSMEVEDKLWNEQFTTQLRRMGLDCIYNGWTKEEKMYRVQELRSRKILIDKTKAPLTYKNLLEAAYDKKSRLASLEKRIDQHGLDCALHGLHEASGEIYFSERGKTPKKPKILGGQERMLRI